MWYIELSLSHGDRRGECKFSSKYAPRGGWRRGRAPHSNNGVVVEFFSRLMLTSSSILNQTRMENRKQHAKNSKIGLSYRMSKCARSRSKMMWRGFAYNEDQNCVGTLWKWMEIL